ncbi:ABC transporter substrate-binding protein [Spiroplasma monobiae]|uniref:Oligopeptide ABC transporter substrate-binding protein n=1 Tax=Spiroplasma monobiae MQ-1 TaxID=1336748 RepID=A0A2K9LUW8_SPISQ|nr:ABC transporter substrate-binding protein [Spiroplasma monobiae]AUM62842.1 oligopeptide ABC transporter substrate-binding protein [Spiroplasma monobiae MQ-1]
MSVWYKKTLGILGLGLAATMVSSSVVSCGAASFDAILNRVWDTSVYRANYTLNVSSWNTAHSMQAEDSRIWSNTYDTFLSTDQYGRIYGSLAVSEYGQQIANDEKYQYVGNHSPDSKEWTYAVREMNWVDTRGNIVIQNRENIVLEGVLNAAIYALNPNNNSDVSELWVSFIEGAEEAQNLFREGGESAAKARRFILGEETIDGRHFGITKGTKWDNDGKTYDTIKFNLTKSAPYFESLLTYSVFSPIYGDNIGVANDYTKALFNGAYYVQQAPQNGKIILKKNENYALKDSTNIETLEYNYLDGGSAAKERTLFESGSTSFFELKSDDLKGWNRYIGKGEESYENPNFGSQYQVDSPDKSASFMMVYNYSNANITNGAVGKAEQERALSASRLLQSKDARAYISTTIDRTEMARYFSKTIDEPGNPSQMLRNTYTGVGVAQDGSGVDYTNYVGDIYKEKTGSVDENPLADGKDPYKGKGQELTKKSQEQLRLDTVKFIQDNNIKTQKVKGYNGERVVLKLILSPSNNTGMNPYINLMMKSFNSISNNPIYIQTQTMSSTDEYRTEGSKGSTDLFMSGWSPDYKDPSSFLETITLTGPYRGYNGTSRLLKTDSSGEYVLANESLRTTATKELTEAFVGYSEGYKTADTEKTVPEERYKAFAEQEYNFFYENFLALPIYTRAMPKVWQVSYLTPYTKSVEAFGTAQFKLYNVLMDRQLRSREEYQKALEEFIKRDEEVKADWNTHRDAAHWRKKTN